VNTVGKNQNTAEPRRTPHVTSKYHALRECESVVVVAGEIFRPLPPPPPAHEFYTFNMSATANPAETVPPLPAPAPPVPAAKKKKKKKRKKRKKPPPSLAAPVMKSRRVARGVTTNFHRITHEIDRVRSDASIDEDTRAQRLDTLTGDLQALGGRTAYQDASIVNTSMFRTSRYVTQVLTRQGVRPKSGSVLPRILEVGAINTQLVNTPWLNTDALDLNSRHPKIQQIDFFEFPCVPGEYDVVVSSMVINCMPTAHQRGALLTKCRRHLRPKGFFFLMLPLLCLKSSPYVRDEDQFRSGVEGVGFKLVEQKMTRKVALFCFQKTEAQHLDAARRCFPDPPRKVKKQGGKKGKRLFSDFAVSIIAGDTVVVVH
jgi:25S rRNA (adenine2142-N1)-methyltransferase